MATDYSPEIRAAMSQDAARDKKRGIKEGSAQDTARDEKLDDARDKARGIAEGSPQDLRLDRAAGIPEEPKDIPRGGGGPSVTIHAMPGGAGAAHPHAILASNIAHAILNRPGGM